MAGIANVHLHFTQAQITQLTTLADQHAPKEMCGLLVGREDTVFRILPIPNISDDPNEYYMDPQGLVSGLYQADSLNLEFLAIFHSHPNSEPFPSETDISRNLTPDIPQLIIGKSVDGWAVRLFMLNNSDIQELAFSVYPT
jgi:proteasome lid subunit RPN8/RPN11